MGQEGRKRARGSKRGPSGQGTFYAEGLRFSCHQCHNCCRGGQEGWVYVTQREIERLAGFTKLAIRLFRHRFLFKDPQGETSLRMRSNGDCTFWDNGCTVYPVRPRQCRTFPFWPENLRSLASWSEVQKTCHGAGKGRLYSFEDIRAVVHGRETRS